MGSTPTPWTEDDLKALKTMIDDGKTIPEIAKALGRSQEGTRKKATNEGWYAYPSRLFIGHPPSAIGAALRQKRGSSSPSRVP